MTFAGCRRSPSYTLCFGFGVASQVQNQDGKIIQKRGNRCNFMNIPMKVSRVGVLRQSEEWIWRTGGAAEVC
jgi:hypothetical protein